MTLTALLILGLVSGSAVGQTEAELDELADEISALGDQIESAQAERSEAANEVVAAKARLDEVTSELGEAQSTLAFIRADIADGEAELAAIQDTLDHFEGALAATRSRIGDARDSLAVQVIELYMNASTAGARVFAFSNASEAAVGFGYVDGAMSDSSSLLNQLDILESEEERQRHILGDQRAAQRVLLDDLASKQEAQQTEVGRVEALQEEARAVAASAHDVVSSLTAEIAQFEQHKEGLEADASALEAELSARESEGATPSGFIRPVPGHVSSPYGYRVHPIFGLRILHTGWDLRAGSGEPIAASAGGVVISAGVRGGYGNAVVIDHGGGLATLYAHQSSMAVQSGQQVEQGQVIGYVGCTGFCTGAHLHFEVRMNGRPVDPSGYVP